MDPVDSTRLKLLGDAVRAWVPILVSLCAISLTIFQATVTRRQARLSVQPRLQWSVEWDLNAGTIGFSLFNVGLGPAVIESLALMVDGVSLGPEDPTSCAEVDRRLGRGGDLWDTSCFIMSDDYVLRPGDRILVYSSRPNPGRPPADYETEAIDFHRIDARAHYCSLYEECWDFSAS